MKTPINGLVLVGGQSVRMGTDKSLLEYHGLPQRNFLYQLLGQYCNEVFFACRANQIQELADFQTIVDFQPSVGPITALLSAFAHNAQKTWLIVACDMPFVGADTIEFLLNHRDATAIATAFLNPETQFPEPLLTIWEPRSAPILRVAFERQERSPLRILQQNQPKLLIPPVANWLLNVNTLEEYQRL